MDGTTDSRESVDPRTRRAAEEALAVVQVAPLLYLVYSEDGTQYEVDSHEGRCTCPDHRHREVACKHLRRVAMATGAAEIPAAVDPDDLLCKTRANGGPTDIGGCW